MAATASVTKSKTNIAAETATKAVQTKSESDKSDALSKPMPAIDPKNTAELEAFQLFLTEVKKIIPKHTNFFIALDEIERIEKPPTIITNILHKKPTILIQQNIDGLERVDTVLYCRLFRDVVGASKTAAFRFVIVTPLHVAIVCGELETVALLCKEYVKHQSINISQLESLSFDSPLDFYIKNLHEFTRHWPSEKLITMYKLLESYGAVSTTMPKIKDLDIDALFDTLHRTMHEIFSKFSKQGNVIFVVGESHSSKYSLLVISIMLCIGRKLGLTKHFQEADEAYLNRYLTKPDSSFVAPASYVPFSKGLGFEVTAVDLDSELRNEDQTELTIGDRDWGMMSEIRKAESHGIATVGTTHLCGMKKYQNDRRSNNTTLVFCFNAGRILETSSPLQRFAQEDPTVFQLPSRYCLEHLTAKEILDAALGAEQRFKSKEDAIKSAARMLNKTNPPPLIPAFSNANNPSSHAHSATSATLTNTALSSSTPPASTTLISPKIINATAPAKNK